MSWTGVKWFKNSEILMKDSYFGFGVVALHSNEICIFYLLMTRRPEEPEHCVFIQHLIWQSGGRLHIFLGTKPIFTCWMSETINTRHNLFSICDMWLLNTIQTLLFRFILTVNVILELFRFLLVLLGNSWDMAAGTVIAIKSKWKWYRDCHPLLSLSNTQTIISSEQCG